MRFYVLHRETIDSTNTTLKRMAGEGASEGTCLYADEQTAGRGRFDRRWLSPRGAGLYLSVLLRPKIETNHLPLISLLGGVIVHDALRELVPANLSLDIKYPNDILLEGKKVCGILAEAGFSGGALAWVVLGMGVNVSQTEFPDGLLYPPASLKLAFGEDRAHPTREAVLQEILDATAVRYAEFVKHPPSILETWRAHSSFAEGKIITVSIGDRRVEGVTRGLRSDGALLVETADGTIEPITVGDVVSAR